MDALIESEAISDVHTLSGTSLTALVEIVATSRRNATAFIGFLTGFSWHKITK
jgi:hypothetical protein